MNWLNDWAERNSCQSLNSNDFTTIRHTIETIKY